MSDNEETDESDEAKEPEDTEDPFLTRLNKEGAIAFNLIWDSGAPFPGAGHWLIYHLDGKYWTCDDVNQVDGPYDSLAKALDSGPIGSATEAIYCEEYSASQLADVLDVSALDVGQQIEINEGCGQYLRTADSNASVTMWRRLVRPSWGYRPFYYRAPSN